LLDLQLVYFNPHVLKIAKKYPKVRFEHAGGLWTDKDPTNVGSYFGYIDEAQHVAGIVAGASTKTASSASLRRNRSRSFCATSMLLFLEPAPGSRGRTR
jgi:basic membrane lipoprotein Med (substrate-binding protein (PBP1-ABC) superfamily)